MLALIVSLPTAFVLPMTPLPTMRRAAVYACDAPEPAPEEASNGGIISFSERALQQLETMREKDPTGKIVLRMGVRAGGCSGMSYVMDLEKPDAVLDEADTVVDLAEGMKCAIDPKSLMFLYGMQLDYSDELIGGGFSFQNPNAEETVSIVRLPMLSPLPQRHSFPLLTSVVQSVGRLVAVRLRQELWHLSSHLCCGVCWLPGWRCVPRPRQTCVLHNHVAELQ